MAGPGGQGAAEGRVQREAGPGSHHTTPPTPPPHSHQPVLGLQVPGKGTALGPQSHGCHGGRATGRAAFPAPWRRTLPMGARAPGPGRGTVGAAVPTSCPSMPPSGIKRPASLEAGGAEPGKLEPWPSAPGLPVGMVAALWNLALALAPAPAPSVGYGQGPEDDRPEPQACDPGRQMLAGFVPAAEGRLGPSGGGRTGAKWSSCASGFVEFPVHFFCAFSFFFLF